VTDTAYRLSVGAFTCTVVSDGTIRVPPPPHTGLSFEQGEIMDVSSLVIEHGTTRLLIDTGCGHAFQDTSGHLAANLKKEGFSPESIDVIIYSHGHTDHVGGTFDDNGKAVFPNARQVVLKEEWDAWASLPESNEHYHMFDIARDVLLKIPEQFDIVAENTEIYPGVRLLPGYGHSPGNAMVGIASGEARLLVVGDLIHSLLELTDPSYYAWLDVLPEPAERLRSEGVAEIAASGVLVYACHFPFPGIGRFMSDDGVLRWEPAA
jgi:glyoxylase-like metal-dependent hydrolase (beta-lactamase superfamily II)